ncbi:MAG: PorT family protein [Bacteroidales bacterium]|nr:PorT family protein [Bacteroidales bacterium]
MKKFSAILFINLFFFGALFAQKADVIPNLKMFDHKRFHFGFTVGLNTSDFYIRNSDNFFDTTQIKQVYNIENYQQPGFHLGPISNLRLGKYFDLRLLLNLTFTQRDLHYLVLKENQDGENYFDTYVMKISSTFLQLPLLLKYKAERINNYRFYVIGGIDPTLDLAAKKKIPENEMPMIRLKQPDVYGEFGVGIDFYLPYFKFSPELKMGVGLNNVAVADNTEYTGAMKYLKSKVFMLSFHFE